MRYLGAALLVIVGLGMCALLLIAPNAIPVFEPYQGLTHGILCGLGFALFCKGLELGLYIWNPEFVKPSNEKQRLLQQAMKTDEARRLHEEEQRTRLRPSLQSHAPQGVLQSSTRSAS